MNNIIIKDEVEIEDLIYEIRGVHVMLDSDLARLYECVNGTKDINKAVKRNIERFPKDFCFQLKEDEIETLRFQFETSKNGKETRGGRRYLPYAFTEQGIAMLAGVLKSEIAINTSINIIKAFIEMRKFLLTNGQVFERITTLEYQQIENNKKFDLVFDKLEKKQISFMIDL